MKGRLFTSTMSIIREGLRMVSDRDSEFINTQMEINSKGNGRMIRNLLANINFMMGAYLMVSSKRMK